MRYEGDIYRPPGEWKSYLLQCTVGCSNNTCTFCDMYKSKKYHVRPVEEVLEDIEMAKNSYYRNTETVFLCDGDAINLEKEYLFTVLDALYKAFPNLRRVTTYAGPLSTLRKTPEELKEIRDHGLQRAYLGVESGDSELLRHVKKGVDAEQMYKAGRLLVDSGFDLWCIVINGLEGGGKEKIDRNAALTADIINRIAPKHLSAMTLMVIPGTPLADEVRDGSLCLQTPWESLYEARQLIAGISLQGLHFTSNHASNYLPIKATLSEEKDYWISQLDSIIQNKDPHLLRTIRGL